MKKYPDKEIIRLLQSDRREEQNKAMLYLYERMYPIVVKYVQKNSGTEKDVDDIFQDGLVAVFKKVRTKSLWEDSNIEAYLYSICRNLWLKKLQKRKREVELTDVHETVPLDQDQEAIVLSQERRQLMDEILKSLGQDCYRLLAYVYYDRRRLREIAELMGFASEQVAKNKKSKCMKKLRTLMKDNPHFKELLKP
ncbi:MAG: sigma-70 family RNA polymerase sigma factor [Bacteroidota bacterium]